MFAFFEDEVPNKNHDLQVKFLQIQMIWILDLCIKEADWLFQCLSKSRFKMEEMQILNKLYVQV